MPLCWTVEPERRSRLYGLPWFDVVRHRARMAGETERTTGERGMKYRIFTNDRGMKRGVPMYSALIEVRAASPEAAREQCPPRFDAPNYAAAVAIHWPASAQSDDEKEWLKRHVGKGL